MRSNASAWGVSILAAFALYLPAAASTTAGDDKAFLRHVRDTYATIDTMWARFSQVNQWELVSPESPYTGQLWVDTEGRVCIEYSAPEGHRLVADGTWMWTYIPESGQVLKSQVQRQGQAVAQLFLDFLAGNRVREMRWESDHVVMRLEPEVDLGVRELEVEVDRESGLARRFVWTDWDGNVSDYRLHVSQPNVTISADRFRFDPPDGVEVVELD